MTIPPLTKHSGYPYQQLSLGATNQVNQSKSDQQACKTYAFLVFLILCFVLYLVSNTNLFDNGNHSATYYNLIFKKTLNNDTTANSDGNSTDSKEIHLGQFESFEVLPREDETTAADSSEGGISVEDVKNSEETSTEESRKASSEEEPEKGPSSSEEVTTEEPEKTSSEEVTTEEPEKGSSEEVTTEEPEKGSSEEVTTEEPTQDSSEENTTEESEETSTYTPIIKRLEGDTACKLPLLKPFEKSLIPLWEEEDQNDPAQCHIKYPQVFRSTINNKVIKFKNASDWTDCCYKSLKRTPTFSNNVDDDSIESEECIEMPKRITKINPEETEFIVIYCSIPDSQKEALNLSLDTSDKVAIDAFSFIVPAKKIREKEQDERVPPVLKDQMNILILGIDSISNMNFMRIMPEVYSYLMQNLSAIGMTGYVKIGDNTYPNNLATLTGKTIAESESLCIGNKFFDDCDFIWKEYSSKGYKTSYSEDATYISTFNYLKRGFARPPTDYYPRALLVYSDSKLGNDHRSNTNVCYGPRLAIDFLLDHARKLAFTLSQTDQKYFNFIFSTSLTHDYISLGKLGEPSVLKTIQWLHSQNYLNNTILMILSDHGMRYGKVRNTRQGKIEENMPAIYFTFPQWFREKYSRAINNMKDNNFRLSTPFDLHETLKDLVDLKSIEDEVISSRERNLNSFEMDNLPRGISMFLPIPKQRTCKMASIPEHFCACHETERLSNDHSISKQATNFAIYTMNSFIAQYPQCSFLTLANITSVFRYFVETSVEDNGDTLVVEEGVKVLFDVNPGSAEFDATVLRINGTGNWTLSDVSRVNMYGNQSHCVDDAKMKKFCYCTDLLDE